MTPDQYNAARITLGWTQKHLAEVVGRTQRQVSRYASDGVDSKTVAGLLRVLVWSRLTLSEQKFDELVKMLTKT